MLAGRNGVRGGDIPLTTDPHVQREIWDGENQYDRIMADLAVGGSHVLLSCGARNCVFLQAPVDVPYMMRQRMKLDVCRHQARTPDSPST